MYYSTHELLLVTGNNEKGRNFIVEQCSTVSTELESEAHFSYILRIPGRWHSYFGDHHKLLLDALSKRVPIDDLSRKTNSLSAIQARHNRKRVN